MARRVLEGQRGRGQARGHPLPGDGRATAAPHEAEEESDEQEEGDGCSDAYADDRTERKALLGVRRPRDLPGRRRTEWKGVNGDDAMLDGLSGAYGELACSAWLTDEPKALLVVDRVGPEGSACALGCALGCAVGCAP